MRNGENAGGRFYFDTNGQVSKVYFNAQDQFTPLFDSLGRAQTLWFDWYRTNPRNPYFRQIWELSYDRQNRLHQVTITSESSPDLLPSTRKMEGSKPSLVRNIRYLNDERSGIIQFENRLPITANIKAVDTTYRYFIGTTSHKEYISKYPNSSTVQNFTYDALGRVIKSVNGNKDRMLQTRNIGYSDAGDEKIDTLRVYNNQKYTGGDIKKSKLNKEGNPLSSTKWKSYYLARIFENGEIFSESKNGKHRVLLPNGTWSEWSDSHLTYRDRIREIEKSIQDKQK